MPHRALAKRAFREGKTVADVVRASRRHPTPLPGPVQPRQLIGRNAPRPGTSKKITGKLRIRGPRPSGGRLVIRDGVGITTNAPRPSATARRRANVRARFKRPRALEGGLVGSKGQKSPPAGITRVGIVGKTATRKARRRA